MQGNLASRNRELSLSARCFEKCKRAPTKRKHIQLIPVKLLTCANSLTWLAALGARYVRAQTRRLHLLTAKRQAQQVQSQQKRSSYTLNGAIVPIIFKGSSGGRPSLRRLLPDDVEGCCSGVHSLVDRLALTRQSWRCVVMRCCPHKHICFIFRKGGSLASTPSLNFQEPKLA